MSAAKLWALSATAADVDATTRDTIANEMKAWAASGGCGVAVVTCHRAELYGLGDAPQLGHTRQLSGDEAIGHLLGVAAGLESAVVGEDDVLHQVRESLRGARDSGPIDYRLARLFEVAIATGRRCRAQHRGSPMSLAGAAIAWAAQHSELRGAPVLIVGAGRVGGALARAAVQTGATITVASRNLTRATKLASLHQAQGVDLVGGTDMVPRMAAVFVALAGPWHEAAGLDTELPAIADLSAPPALPATARVRARHHLGIDQLFTKGTPPPGYLESARPLIEAGRSELLDWFASRERLAATV